MRPGDGVETVLFDLDGTLVDTAPDLADALNRLRREHDLEALSLATVRPEVSNGSYALVRLGFGPELSDPVTEALRDRLLTLYAERLSRHSRLFPGMAEVLEALERNCRRWGIVTNKPAFLTDPLVADLALRERASCVVSGDTLANRKPHPEPLLHAAQACGSEPAACIYVGDARRDVEAAKRAGMRALVACFGYIGAGEEPDTWAADGYLDSPGDLLVWLSKQGVDS